MKKILHLWLVCLLFPFVFSFHFHFQFPFHFCFLLSICPPMQLYVRQQNHYLFSLSATKVTTLWLKQLFRFLNQLHSSVCMTNTGQLPQTKDWERSSVNRQLGRIQRTQNNKPTESILIKLQCGSSHLVRNTPTTLFPKYPLSHNAILNTHARQLQPHRTGVFYIFYCQAH